MNRLMMTALAGCSSAMLAVAAAPAADAQPRAVHVVDTTAHASATQATTVKIRSRASGRWLYASRATGKLTTYSTARAKVSSYGKWKRIYSKNGWLLLKNSATGLCVRARATLSARPYLGSCQLDTTSMWRQYTLSSGYRVFNSYNGPLLASTSGGVVYSASSGDRRANWTY